MRKLTAKDLFPVCTILKKIGFSKVKSVLDNEDMKKLMKGGKDADASQVGMAFIFDVLGIVLENLPLCEKEIFAFCASVLETEQKDVENMSPAQFAKTLKEIITHPDFKDFFKEALSFINLEKSDS
jgi:hypothetical protein